MWKFPISSTPFAKLLESLIRFLKQIWKKIWNFHHPCPFEIPQENIFWVNKVLEQGCIKIIMYKIKEAIWSAIHV
jgi:hypothetical protein